MKVITIALMLCKLRQSPQPCSWACSDSVQVQVITLAVVLCTFCWEQPARCCPVMTTNQGTQEPGENGSPTSKELVDQSHYG